MNTLHSDLNRVNPDGTVAVCPVCWKPQDGHTHETPEEYLSEVFLNEFEEGDYSPKNHHAHWAFEFRIGKADIALTKTDALALAADIHDRFPVSYVPDFVPAPAPVFHIEVRTFDKITGELRDDWHPVKAESVHGTAVSRNRDQLVGVVYRYRFAARQFTSINAEYRIVEGF